RLDLHERAERGEVADLALEARAHRVLLRQRHPRVLFGLLHAERDLLLGLVHLEHDRLDRLADGHDLRGVPYVAGPAHLRDVHEALDPRLQLDERAVVGDRAHLALHARADGILRRHVLPGTRLQLIQLQADVLASHVELVLFYLTYNTVVHTF